MLQCTEIYRFTQYLFDDERLARQAAEIVRAILAAQSPRLSEIARHMSGGYERNYKRLQRFLQAADPQMALARVYQDSAPFVIGDPTEMPRPDAKRTPYVGWLSDGETRGYWLLVLASPFRGRALPFSFVTYSSKTIAHTGQSRNRCHAQAFENIREILGEKPLVLDREFSYLSLLQSLVDEDVNFVIRLNQGSHPPHFTDPEGKPVLLKVLKGETRIEPHVFYKGEVEVNVIGWWRKGLKQPIWVMTNLDPQLGLAYYLQRMKIEETFRDQKSLLHLHQAMNHKTVWLEKMLALVLLAYTLGVLVGEELRDQLYGLTTLTPFPQAQPIPNHPNLWQTHKWCLYSGLFVLLKQRLALTTAQFRLAFQNAFAAFMALLHYPVRIPVCSSENLLDSMPYN